MNMTREEHAIVYFKDMRKRMCEDHLEICPKDSVAYRATLIEKGFYDAAIKALEQVSITKNDLGVEKVEVRKPCINYEDGCEEWAGCPCVHFKARK